MAKKAEHPLVFAETDVTRNVAYPRFIDKAK